jgi:hypothetical protein
MDSRLFCLNDPSYPSDYVAGERKEKRDEEIKRKRGERTINEMKKGVRVKE